MSDFVQIMLQNLGYMLYLTMITLLPLMWYQIDKLLYTLLNKLTNKKRQIYDMNVVF